MQGTVIRRRGDPKYFIKFLHQGAQLQPNTNNFVQITRMALKILDMLDLLGKNYTSNFWCSAIRVESTKQTTYY